MERLELVDFTAIAHHAANAATRRGMRAAMAVSRRAQAFLFVTYAVEIEGEPSLYHYAEGTDD